jgi:hypothetical protein
LLYLLDVFVVVFATERLALLAVLLLVQVHSSYAAAGSELYLN